MTRILPVRLATGSRPLWFDAQSFDAKKGDAVVVTTARGVEYGYADSEPFEASEEQLEPIKSSLKAVLRLGTEEDARRMEESKQLSEQALPIFRQIVAEEGIDMHPVSVEYLFDGDKAIFYFDAEDRVDFRDLVRKLAAVFHVRVDMRQIGPRDEARLVGGLGHCGQELCCKRLGGELCSVSIRMAKEQDLSLNPSKISGLCGRLMCCLRYEYDAYKDFKQRAPKVGSLVATPEGMCKVCEHNVPREIITLQAEDEKRYKVALADMEKSSEEAAKPDTIPADVWEHIINPDPMLVLGGGTYSTSQFTAQDTLGSASVHHRTQEKPQASAEQPEAAPRKLGTRRKKSTTKEQDKLEEPSIVRKSRRRSTRVSADGTTEVLSSEAAEAKSNAAPARQERKSRGRVVVSGKAKSTPSEDSVRRAAAKQELAATEERGTRRSESAGQNSVRETERDAARKLNRDANRDAKRDANREKGAAKPTRRRRRQGQKASQAETLGATNQPARDEQNNAKTSRREDAKARVQTQENAAASTQANKPRPGRNSSALRRPAEPAAAPLVTATGDTATKREARTSSHPNARRRRRSRTQATPRSEE